MNAQGAIHRILSGGTMSAKIVGTPNLDGPEDGEYGFGAQFLESCRVSAATRDRPVIGIWPFELQQLRQSSRASAMHCGTNRDLDTLQIETAAGLAVAEEKGK
jgi:hypothetical protein